MSFLNILAEIGTVILLGYLSLTNSIADSISSVFESETATYEEPAQQELPQVSKIKSTEGIIPRVLLDNTRFQQAAVFASKEEATASTKISEIPLETLVRDALVNVYCQYKTPEYIRTTTGSGYFINQKGVIITNAHVAQFLLLEENDNRDVDVDCVIRTGDPASPKYEAELLYISPMWIYENANLVSDESPRGTGERDYALLYVSKTLDSTPLPVEFPFLPIDTNLLSRGVVDMPVVTAGYPAEALLRNGADAKLELVFAKSSIGVLYTFGSNYADIFSITDSPVGEHGASGGPIVTTDTKQSIGIIVTKGDESSEGSRSLRALTLSYIDRTMSEETGFSLAQNMQGDVAFRGNIFKNVMTPFLAGILEEEIAQ